MNPVAVAVLRAGLVSPAQLKELCRFSPVLLAEIDTIQIGDPVDLITAAHMIEEAQQSEQSVLVRETDLEILKQFAETSQRGTLHVDLGDDQAGDIDVRYGRTRTGEYVLSWRSDSIREALINGLTYLVEGDTQKQVFFRDVRELFFGEQKAFMVCAPLSDNVR